MLFIALTKPFETGKLALPLYEDILEESSQFYTGFIKMPCGFPFNILVPHYACLLIFHFYTI